MPPQFPGQAGKTGLRRKKSIRFKAISTLFFRWNPFAKKYGIFGVIHAHSKRNRVVSKHGKLNTFRRPDENKEKHR